MKNDFPTIEERIGTALAKGNLTPREGPASLDKVMALGMVGVEQGMADAFIRLKVANDPKMYHEALKAVVNLGKTLNAQKNWRVRPILPLARAVLNYWLADVCPACTGKRDDDDRPTAMQMTGTPFLEGVSCLACNGTGKRPYPWISENRHDRMERHHNELLREVQAAEGRIRKGLRERLSTQEVL